MIKILCFMNRKLGLSLEEFKTYYEEIHVPLVNRLLGFHCDYRRNFVEEREHETSHLGQAHPGGPGFDVLTELTYASEGMYRKTLEALADPDIGSVITEDEMRFLDRTTMRVVIVDERRSVIRTPGDVDAEI